MITNDEQLNQAVERLGGMYRAMAALRAEVLPLNARNFALMAEGPLDEIRRMQAEIDAYVGVEAAEEHDADVWLRLYGRDVGWPDAPTSVLAGTLEAFRKGIQTVAELIATGQVATGSRSAIRRACDMRVVAFQRGSLRIGLRLPDELDVDFGSNREKSLGHRALVEYLKVAAWVSSAEPQPDLGQQIEQSQKRRVLFNALTPLVPRPRGDVECIEISSRLVPGRGTIRLTRGAYHRLVHGIERTAATEVETYTGHLREIDLDHRRFTLRDVADARTVRCTFQDDLSETVRAALGRRVRVTGSRLITRKHGTGAILGISQLEVLPDQGSGTASRGNSV
jgi:hypothetical protein